MRKKEKRNSQEFMSLLAEFLVRLKAMFQFFYVSGKFIETLKGKNENVGIVFVIWECSPHTWDHPTGYLLRLPSVAVNSINVSNSQQL